MSTLPPLRREIIVDTDPATVFEVFTAQIGQWWPMAEKSVFGADATDRHGDQARHRGRRQRRRRLPGCDDPPLAPDDAPLA